MVWQGYDGSDGEIFLYSGGITTQLTDNAYHDQCPQINDAEQVVWEGWVVPSGYSAVANAEASTFGSNSLTGSGISNELALVLIPMGAVIFLRILRRKR